MCVYDRVLLEQVEHWQEYLALVNMILFCTGVPGHYPVSETTSSLTLTFWYTLQVKVNKLDKYMFGGFWVLFLSTSKCCFLFSLVTEKKKNKAFSSTATTNAPLLPRASKGVLAASSLHSASLLF